jgi:hypothetical protein
VAMRFPSVGAAVLALCARATACPFCEDGPGGQNPVRAAVFDDNFGRNFGAVALPFALVFAATALWRFGPPRRRLSPEGTTNGSAS